jgi:hypothetical protein
MKWEEFWNQYRKSEPQNAEDLLIQVGRTINKSPISAEAVQITLDRIIYILNLKSDSVLVDFCCGNGIFTYELSNKIKFVYGVDFSQHLISSAKKYKARPNIVYHALDALTPVKYFVDKDNSPNFFLMNAALAYFSPSQLSQILFNIKDISCHADCNFLITDIPDISLLHNFYNTPDRMKRYYENQKMEFNDNDGLGRWWSREEIYVCAEGMGFSYEAIPQPEILSNYRMDALLSLKNN